MSRSEPRTDDRATNFCHVPQIVCFVQVSNDEVSNTPFVSAYKRNCEHCTVIRRSSSRVRRAYPSVHLVRSVFQLKLSKWQFMCCAFGCVRSPFLRSSFLPSFPPPPPLSVPREHISGQCVTLAERHNPYPSNAKYGAIPNCGWNGL